VQKLSGSVSYLLNCVINYATYYWCSGVINSAYCLVSTAAKTRDSSASNGSLGNFFACSAFFSLLNTCNCCAS
jgi:hypothetical protein